MPTRGYPGRAPGGRVEIDARSAEFLEALRGHVTDAVEDELVGTDWSAEHCPWIDYWFAYYAGRSREDLVRALRKFAPDARNAQTIEDFVPAIVARVRTSVATWRGTGRIDDPAGFDIDGGANGERIGDRTRFAVDALADGRVLTGLPTAITETLGSSFGDVRLHTGPTAARIAERENALAFAVGNHVVLGARAPRPGTLEGDGLLAHELAHVQQQRTAPRMGQALTPQNAAGESNADAAVTQVARSHFGVAKRGTWSALPTRLSLSRCKDNTGQDKVKEIKELEQRKASLDATYSTATNDEFSKLAATDAQRTAVEHWLAVRKFGRGTTTGTRSGEEGLPECSCTSYVADVLRHTYRKQGRIGTWDDIHKKALALNTGKLTGLNGLQLQSALISERGWKAIYFAPDPTYQHYRMRQRDDAGAPVVGPDGPLWKRDEHAEWTYRAVKNGKLYRDMLKISHRAVDYRPEAANPTGPTPEQSKTVKDTSGLDKLAQIPFGVVTVRGAYHMAFIIYGVIYEAHLNKTSYDSELYESKPLAEWGWNEGVVVAPGDEVDKAFGAP